MALYVKFYSATTYLSGQVAGQAIDWTNDTFKIALTNSAPSESTNTKFSDITEIAAGSGYTAGGASLAFTFSKITYQEIINATAITWTASGGDIGPFRYIVFYDSTPSDQPLLGYWDYGSNFTITSGNAFQWQPNGSATTGGIMYLQ